MNEHDRWHIRPERREKWNCVYLVDYQVDAPLQVSSIMAKGSPVNAPLLPRADDMDAFKVFVSWGSRKRSRKPLDIVALSN
jgi:hypothetical protein